ncbi:amino acid ABC transporter substrate-binding protein, PAAT family [Faunimonas pinastri]|uniref:Amino acid ABC transporter substrate-binding protein, PAAT family n=2 Tax=Faunimonas pinastri TaxID=1855383 RepID=A0A1H9HMU0_9HYPH|nr:amino acid ABC transporter substrate-binding protein, PAAT family [Faunimonas pinastri]
MSLSRLLRLACLLVLCTGAAYGQDARSPATTPAPPPPLTTVPATPSPMAAAAQGAEPVIPNFWDPHARLERPSAHDLHTIRFLLTDDFPPFSFRDRRGVLIGFDVDLVRAVCDVLAVPCAIQVRPFDTLVQGLADKQGDAIVAGLDPTGGNAQLISTSPYLKIPARFVTRRDRPFDPANKVLRRTVAAVCGSAHEAYLKALFPNLQLACKPDLATALAELRAGHAAAVFGNAVNLAFWLNGAQSADCCAFAGGPYLDERYFGAGLAIDLRPDDRRLKAALDYALREVQRNGSYEELYLRYFPIGLF